MADDRDVVAVVVDDNEVSEIVTKFLLNTCRLLQPNKHRANAAAACSMMLNAVVHRVDENGELREFRLIPLTTGSSVEFYIQPMLSFVGDIDVMIQRSNELAIPEGNRPPTELPAEFDGRVGVYEITDSEFPGYVYLMLSFVLTEDSDTGKYTAMQSESDKRYRARKRTYDGIEFHGPAVTLPASETMLSQDVVHCVRCLSWPPQAADWPTRLRNYVWPDLATVDLVVNNGCDVVQVAHPEYRQDELMIKTQWRLSFSRAEIVLLNSWISVQQIVYHMLRVFKTECLTDVTDSTGTKTSTINNYHFKTLMLWACEKKTQSRCIGDINVVSICNKLLHIFADWLEHETCPHYFVNNCDLIYNTDNLEILASQLSSITETSLSTWFVNNYLRRCAQLCPDEVSRLFDDISTRMKLQTAVSAVVKWRQDSALDDLWDVYNVVEFVIPRSVSLHSLTVPSCHFWINELTKINPCLRNYFSAVTFLHIAKQIAKRSFNDELWDVLTIVVGQFVGKRRYCYQLSSELSLSQAGILLKVVVNHSCSTMQSIEFELSKAYLHRALRCKDSTNVSIYCLANVYLAVLYCTTGQYQTAINHCTLVMRSQDHSQCSSHVVEGELLPKINDNIDNVLGLAVFYQYIRKVALNQQQTQNVVAFTTELFAHYLYIRCLSLLECQQIMQMPSTEEVHRHIEYVIDMDKLFTADILLIKSVKMSEANYHYKPVSGQHEKAAIIATELDTSELVELLQQSAVEHLTTYRHFQAEHFSSLVTIVTTDFEAMYAYKRGDYQRCLQLSTENVLRLTDTVIEPLVLALPEFIQLMDDDIVSLTALTLVVDPDCRDNHDNVCLSQWTLSLYLMTQCQLKLRHSVTSLIHTLEYIEVTEGLSTLDHLTLKLTEHIINHHIECALSL